MKFVMLLFLKCYVFSVRLMEKPLFLNVTYESPWKDLEEDRKFMDEHFKFINKTKEIGKKFTDDMNLLKMMFNIQNNQIYKLREIIEVNKAIINQLAARQ
jgi:hypothetical protein